MYKSTAEGKGGIIARVVADSISDAGIRITTLELEYPRFIHSELMTHRMFSRNAASSRAIPINKMIDQVRNNPAMPIHWGANQSGMQANHECYNEVDFDWLCGDKKSKESEDAWQEAADRAADIAQAMSDAGYHKQIVNRLLEPFQMMKTVVTATEWNNFFHLRGHEDAQPEISELARVMRIAMQESIPEELKYGEFHTPYVEHCEDGDSIGYYVIDEDGNDIHMDHDTALKVSASCCAQVSYRLLDQSVDKAVKIYDQLVESKPVHASPFEHQSTPMEYPEEHDYQSVAAYINGCMEGATHTDKNGRNWSGNLKGWIQHRQLIKDSVVSG